MKFLSPLTITFIVVFLFLVLVLSARLSLCLSFRKEKGKKIKYNLSLTTLRGFIKINIPLSKKQKKSSAVRMERQSDESFFSKVKKAYKTFELWKKVYEESHSVIRKRVHAEKMSFELTFGMGDAASTGIVTGIVWTGIYNVIAFISKHIVVCKPHISVTPLYNESSCSLGGECIIRITTVNLIIMMASIGINYFKTNRIKKNKKAAM